MAGSVGYVETQRVVLFTAAARLFAIEEWNEAAGLILRPLRRLMPRGGPVPKGPLT